MPGRGSLLSSQVPTQQTNSDGEIIFYFFVFVSGSHPHRGRSGGVPAAVEEEEEDEEAAASSRYARAKTIHPLGPSYPVHPPRLKLPSPIYLRPSSDHRSPSPSLCLRILAHR